MDFNFFDAILDNIFVINEAQEVQYCNEPAASLCDSSVRRMMNKPLNKFISFPDLKWSSNEGSPEPMDLQEIKFKAAKSDEEGLSQVTVTETELDGQKLFVIMVRNVTLEEVLHKKHQQQLVELENYSKNLEKMVAERTEEVRAANVMLNAIMDSLGQGFLVFDKSGKCGSFYTKACTKVLGTEPNDKMVWDVLSLSEKDKETFKMWVQAVFSNTLSFDSLKDLAVHQVNPQPNQFVNLDYYKIDEEDASKSQVVLVATDVTAEHVAKLELEREKQFAKMVVKIVSSRSQFSRFLSFAEETINEVKDSIDNKSMDVKSALRYLHTLEGEAALFSVTSLWDQARFIQEEIQDNVDGDIVTHWPPIIEAAEALKKSYHSYLNDQDDLLKALGIGKGETFEFTKDSILDTINYLKGRGLGAEQLSEIENKLLSKPIKALVSHYDEAITVVSQKLNKNVNPIVWSGTDITVRPDVFNPLMGSLVHVFRNAVDHGVEPTEDRQMMGKPDFATIHFDCKLEDNDGEDWLKIVISDDGQGIDTDKLRKRLPDSENLSDFDVKQKIFDAGLSSREEVSEFSGRGVGMNAVKDEVEKLGGTVVAESEVGKGTVITIHVPYRVKSLASVAA